MKAIRVKDFRSLIPQEFASLFSDDECLAGAFGDGKAIDLELRTVRFVASDDSVDHHGEIVAQGAFHKLRSTYERNPVLMAAHQHRLWNGNTASIGSVIELDTQKSPLIGVARFNDTQAGEDHWRAYKKGDQRAFSVGFRVRDTERQDGVTVITEAELLEISAVMVPANRNALVVNQYITGRISKVAQETDDTGKSKEMFESIKSLEQKIDAFQETIAKDYSVAFGDAKDGDDEGDQRDGAVNQADLCELLEEAGHRI